MCYAQDGTVVLSAGLYEGSPGVWEVIVQEPGGPGRAAHQFEDEGAARRALTVAYHVGRRHGHWQVHHDPASGARHGLPS